MKLDARRAPAFLRDPGPVRVALLHGEDEGAVREGAASLTCAVVGTADDPFRVAWLGREEHGALAAEAQAIAMTGGRRVVRVRDAGDALAAAVREVLEASGDSLVVLEAGQLPARSKLRALVEGSPRGAALACYPEEGRALREMVERVLAADRVTADADAMAWLLDHLGADRAGVRAEAEKLALYAGPGGRLGLDDVRACIGEQAALDLDDALFAATAGEVAAADRSVDLALAAGLAPVAAARGMLGHLGRLRQARLRMADGMGAAEAARTAQPPVFFRRQPQFARALAAWSETALAAAMDEARATELACKRTGAPDALLVRRLVLALARQAQARR